MLVSCYCKLAQVERFFLEKDKQTIENVERAMGVLSVIKDEGQQLQLHYLEEVVRAATVDSCLSFHLTENCVTASLSYYKVFFPNHHVAGKSDVHSHTLESLQVSVNFHSKNTSALLYCIAKMPLSLARLGRTVESIKTPEEALSSFSNKENSGTSQMLLYSCFGFAQTVSGDENDRPCAEKNLQKSLDVCKKLVRLLEHRQKSDDLGAFPTSDDDETVRSSLAVMRQAYCAMKGKEKEVMEVYQNLSLVLLSGNDEKCNESYAQVLRDRMLYMSTDNLKSFQNKVVTISVIVNEEPGMASSNACTLQNSCSYQQSMKVQSVD